MIRHVLSLTLLLVGVAVLLTVGERHVAGQVATEPLTLDVTATQQAAIEAARLDRVNPANGSPAFPTWQAHAAFVCGDAFDGLVRQHRSAQVETLRQKLLTVADLDATTLQELHAIVDAQKPDGGR